MFVIYYYLIINISVFIPWNLASYIWDFQNVELLHDTTADESHGVLAMPRLLV